MPAAGSLTLQHVCFCMVMLRQTAAESGLHAATLRSRHEAMWRRLPVGSTSFLDTALQA